MLVVSLHQIKIHAPIGLYREERILGNDFETDVDVFLPDTPPWHFADYTLIRSLVAEVFSAPHELLEDVAYTIHGKLLHQFPASLKIKVTVRKYRPPMPGDVGYAQVVYEK